MSGHIILQNKLESSHELSLAEEFVQLYYEKLDKQQYVSIDFSILHFSILLLMPEKLSSFKLESEEIVTLSL